MSTLRNQHKVFVDEYLIDFNVSRAYKVAYPNTKNDDTARVNGSKVLTRSNIQEYINKRIKDREIRTEITQDRVPKELASIAFQDATAYAKVKEEQAIFTTESGHRIPLENNDGTPIMIKNVELTESDKLTTEQKKAIAGIKRGRNGIEVATCDKVKALELLGRHLGMFVDRTELSGKVEGVTIINDIPRKNHD